jgi:peptidoglycan/LPS O-acetylase OafA/YrhL
MSNGYQSTAPAQPAWLGRGTVPTLNGLRAVSIALVIIGHYARRPLHDQLPLAEDVGVMMFFVISGFLITLLMQRERWRRNTVSLKDFYIRRALRILPAYFTFLFVLFLFQCAGNRHPEFFEEAGFKLDIPRQAWLVSLTYTASIWPPAGWDLAHMWSLSVEEHFYLVWPLLFSFLSRRNAFRFCIGVIIGGPLMRTALCFILPMDQWDQIGRMTLGRIDCIAWGCLLALLATNGAPVLYRKRDRRTLQWRLLWSTILLVAVKAICNSFRRYEWLAILECVLAPSVYSLSMVGIIWCCANNTKGIVSELLDSSLASGIGILSYSMYLWQEPFVTPARGTGIFDFPYNLAALMGCAMLSYFVVERPFLKLKDRFAMREPVPVNHPEGTGAEVAAPLLSS